MAADYLAPLSHCRCRGFSKNKRTADLSSDFPTSQSLFPSIFLSRQSHFSLDKPSSAVSLPFLPSFYLLHCLHCFFPSICLKLCLCLPLSLLRDLSVNHSLQTLFSYHFLYMILHTKYFTLYLTFLLSSVTSYQSAICILPSMFCKMYKIVHYL